MPEPTHQPESLDPPTVALPLSAAGATALILGRYRLLGEVGDGGMGKVYKAEHIHLKHLVAIKTVRLDRQAGSTSLLVERFVREMVAIAAIQDLHVVRATDGGHEDGTYYLVMEYVPGTDLERLARELGPLPAADACELIRQAALGLASIHARGCIHRDIKPSNLLLSREGIVKIADLGLARLINLSEPPPELTPEGDGMGTPDYMAPEQAANARTADVRADIYSLGCSLFRLIAGQAPYPAPRFRGWTEKLLAHQLEPIPRVREVLETRGVPGDPATLDRIDAVLQLMLAKDPKDRYANPQRVAEALAPLAIGCDLAALQIRLRPGGPIAGDAPPPLETCGNYSVQPVMDRPIRQPTEDHETPTLPRRPRWLPAAIGLGLLLAGLLVLATQLGWFGFFVPATDGGPPAPPQQPVPQEMELDHLARLQWHSLLERPPKVLLWPQDGGISHWHHDSTPQVTAQCQQLGLLQLGETHLPDYRYCVDLLQARKKGGIGIYWGCRLPDEADKGGRLQFLELREQAGNAPFNFTRGFMTLHRKRGPRLTASSTSVGSQTLVELNQSPVLSLEVVVKNHTLESVRVNGNPLKELGELINSKFTPADYQGGLGLIINCSDGTFRNAQFQNLSGAP